MIGIKEIEKENTHQIQESVWKPASEEKNRLYFKKTDRQSINQSSFVEHLSYNKT